MTRKPSMLLLSCRLLALPCRVVLSAHAPHVEHSVGRVAMVAYP